MADLQSSLHPSGTHQQPAFVPAHCQARVNPVASACFRKSVQLTSASSLSSQAMISSFQPTLKKSSDNGRLDCFCKHILLYSRVHFQAGIDGERLPGCVDSSWFRERYSKGLSSGFRGNICQNLMPLSILGPLVVVVVVICNFFTFACKLRTMF